MSTLRAAALVFAGGVVGTAGRHGVAEWFATASAWPWPTFVVNILGSLLLGVVVVRFARPDDAPRLLLGTGVLGGFTTYSAFAIETDRLFREDHAMLAVLYPVATVAVGTGAALLGMVLARRSPA